MNAHAEQGVLYTRLKRVLSKPHTFARSGRLPISAGGISTGPTLGPSGKSPTTTNAPHINASQLTALHGVNTSERGIVAEAQVRRFGTATGSRRDSMVRLDMYGDPG